MKSTFTKLIALLVLAVMMFALASCNQSATPNEEHKHTYSDKWTYDATNHWKVSTCADGDECKTAIAQKAAHTLSGDKCSVCGWTKPADPKPEVHTHTYAETLTAGETTHWYAATCNANAECATAKKDEAAHDFANGDCVCGAKAPVHEHTYAETLTAGETTHWYAATCNANAECATAKKDEAAHDFTNGNCVCGKLAPAGSEWNPIAIPSFPASITLNFTAELVDAEEWIYYTFTAAETKTLRVILPENLDMLVPQGEGYVYVSGTYDVELVAGTTYVIPFASEVVGEYTVTADYYVPTVAADISGTYYAYGTNEGGAITYNGTVVIDAANATLVYTFIGRTGNTNVVEYTYTITDGVVTLSNANGPINPNMAIYFGLLELDEDGMPAVFWYNGYEYTLNDFMMVTISGNYSYNVDDSTTVIVSFISGYVYFVYGEDNKVIYSYKVEKDGSVTLTDDEDNVVTDVEIILDENNVPVSVVVGGTQYILEEYVEQEEVLTGIEGTYDGIAMMSQGSLQVVITSTTVTFNYSSIMQGDSTATYDYTIVDGAVVLTKDGETVTAPEAAITLGDDGKPVSAVYNMTSYDLTSASSDGETGDDDVAFAGAGSETDPYVVAGAGSMDINADYYTPVFVTVNAGMTATLGEGAQFITNADGPLGTTVTPSETTTYMVYADSAACTVTLTATEPVPEPDGTEDNPFVLESIPSELTFTGNHDYYYTYTATEAATIVINKLAGSYMTITANDYESKYNEDYTNATYTIYIAAGETIKLNPWVDSSADDAGTLTWTYTFTVSAPILSGSVDKPVSISKYQNNSLDQPGSDDEGYSYFTYNSYMDGTLTLTFTGSVDVKYGTDLTDLTAVSAQTEVVIDIANGDEVYVLIKGDSTVTFTAATAYKLGTEYNPIILENWDGDQTCSYTGSDVWYQITGGENGGYVTLSSTFATANLGAGSSTYSVKYSTTGSIRFYVGAYETAYIVIGDTEASASAEIAFNLSFVAGEHELDGSADYPYVIESLPVTDSTCSFGGGYAYVWYKLNVSKTGYLTLSSATANARLVVSSMADAWASDAVSSEEGSVRYATTGGTLYVGIMTADYEAADITFSVSFEEGELQPDGSANLPYTAVVGENTCAFPGGADMVWYTITVESDCTLTVSSSYISDNHTDGQWTHPNGDTCAWIIIGDTADQYSGLSNNLYSESSISAMAGTTYYIGIADWGETEANITFTVTVTPAA